MTRYRTTQEWADKYNQGNVLHGELLRVKERGLSIANRTHVLRLTRPFGEWDTLTFDPSDLVLSDPYGDNT